MDFTNKITITKKSGESLELDQRRVKIRENDNGLMALSYVAPVFEAMDLEIFFEDLLTSEKIMMDISGTGGFKQNYYKDNINGQRFYGVATLKAAAYWVPVSIFRVGGGIDAFYDGYYSAVNDEFAALNPGAPVTYFGKTYLKTSDVKNCFRVGISIQPEFIIGHLTAGIHVGFYVFDPVKNLEPYAEAKAADDAGEAHSGRKQELDQHRGIFCPYNFAEASNYQDGWCYMQFVLKYHVLDHLFVQLGLKTHGVRAEFIDAGIGVAF